MKRREPTIPIADVERRAREMLGEALERVECKPRKRRSERITLHLKNVTLTFTHASYQDPDAVRKAVLAFLEDCQNTAQETARKLLDSEGP